MSFRVMTVIVVAVLAAACGPAESGDAGITGGGTAATGGGTSSTGGGGGGEATGGGQATGGGSALDAGMNSCTLTTYGGSAIGTADWDTEVLAAHNVVRSCAMPVPAPALPALTWNAAAKMVAQNWANNCQFMHNANRGDYGENIFAGSSSPSSSGLVKLWAAEGNDYTLATNSCASGKVCGHYTQLVWRSTTSVGCAAARCTTGSPFGGTGFWYLVVCDYAPPGNFNGEKPY